MDPLTEILAGVEGGWRLLFSVPPIPMADKRNRQNGQLFVGVLCVLIVCGLRILRGA